MSRRFSIAQARTHLPQLVHSVERGRPVEITRRGKPVAVLVSAAEYERMVLIRPRLWDAVVGIRERFDMDRAGLEDEEFRDLGDRSPGREFSW
jgi:prevent-host-death family protein